MIVVSVQGGLRVVWSMPILCATALHEPKKTPLGRQFKKSGSVMHCAYVLAQTLYLDVRAGRLGTHLDTHFVVFDKVMIKWSYLLAQPCTYTL